MPWKCFRLLNGFPSPASHLLWPWGRGEKQGGGWAATDQVQKMAYNAGKGEWGKREGWGHGTGGDVKGHNIVVRTLMLSLARDTLH